MKVKCDPRQITVSQTNLSKALGLTTGRISQLVKEGIVFKDENDKSGAVFLVRSIQSYTAYSGNAESSEELDFMAEKAKHEKVKRELSELKLAKEEGRAYDAVTVEMVMTEMVSNLRTQLLGLPSKLAPMLAGAGRDEIYAVMTREIEDKLLELSDYNPDMFMSEEVVDSESAEASE